jgi:uncharacterized GH25 family protein
MTLTKVAHRLALIACLSGALSAQAHEFWINPAPNPLHVGDTARLTLEVGEFFRGEKLPFVGAQTVALREYSVAGVRDLAPILSLRAALPVLSMSLSAVGTQMVIFDSQPSLISLPADIFHSYLHYEGLDFIKASRVAAGTATQPGRERYRRYVKTLIRADAAKVPLNAVQAAAPAAKDMTYAVHTGQRLELVPQSDPLTMAPGDALTIQVLFDGAPLAGALVKAWNKEGPGPGKVREGQTLTILATTSADGQATVNLPYAGPWTISVVHMIPAVGVKDIDWESLWGNLSFSVAQPVGTPAS